MNYQDYEKKIFFETILTVKDYETALIKLDLAGVKMTKNIEEWLKLYYDVCHRFDEKTSKVPDFPTPQLVIDEFKK